MIKHENVLIIITIKLLIKSQERERDSRNLIEPSNLPAPTGKRRTYTKEARSYGGFLARLSRPSSFSQKGSGRNKEARRDQ